MILDSMVSTILVVDDDPSIVNLLKENLEDQGYRVLAGFDGQAALQMARNSVPSLIILDVNMPLINGLKALEFLRGNETTRNIPVIFLTGENSDRVSPALDAATRVTHLKKPIDLEDLNSLVRQTLAKYNASY